MAVWWVVYLARLTDEKVDIAAELGASPEYVEELHQQEISRQIMLGSEGVAFLLLTMVGIWLIYRSVSQAERLRRHQENFLMAVTHELKTPLASMAVYLDTLESPRIPDEKKQTVMPRIREDIRRLDRLVENILQAGRFDSVGYRPERRRIELDKMLHALLDQLVQDQPKMKLEIERDIESGLAAEIDGPVVKRAVSAVLDNAVRYAGKPDVRISAHLHRQGKTAEIVIADQGVGIEAKELKLIFDRFYRVGDELTRGSSGTGLGLYLCREMIRAHGGSVRVRSDGPGKGAEFTISLPLDGER
jgi:signal transduction histidine kinase